MSLFRGTLNIGASITIGIYILPDILGRFRKEYPHLHINLDISLMVRGILYIRTVSPEFIAD
ncbi:MAG: LysR substrate-binding domain-containing protein [Syntrophales bacterium]